MKNLSITTKLIIFVSILGIVCVFAIGYISIRAANVVLHETAVNQIESLENSKKYLVENYLSNSKKSMEVLKMFPSIRNILGDHEKGKKLNLNTTNLSEVNSFAMSNNMDNVIIMGAGGPQIIANLTNSQIKENQIENQNTISKLWKECMLSNRVVLTDIVENSNLKPSMYIGTRIEENGKILGVVLASLEVKPISDFMINDGTINKTAITYIVGEDNLLRTNSSNSKSTTILNKKEISIATKKAFDGYRGTELIDNYSGKEVMSSYSSIDIDDLNWAIITEVESDDIFSGRNSLVNAILIVSIIVLIVMFPSLYLIGRVMIKPLKKEIIYAKEIAEGNLEATLDIDQKDEIGELAESLRQMVDKTKAVIVSVVNAGNNLADASFQLSGASQDISIGASQQASSIEEISASIEEMTSNIEQNADNANKTEIITQNVNSKVVDGSAIILSSVEAMEKIADKISIISDIAFQTNILALNASVEAARAGEYGKGFGVVASEVGKLAEKTKAAAAEINEISKSSVEIAEKTKNIMNDIVPSIKNSSVLVQEISAASKEQRDASDQINNAIQLLNDISQQNAASSEEMATNSEELSGQAEQLLNVIAHFKVEKGIHTNNDFKKGKRKLISDKKSGFDNNDKANTDKGININLSTEKDNLDDGFERF
ncbi:MAG: hypothetical protein C0598_10365 [Marinilabiliales bacterium]|nr:MAG: hypothetical protein C0598_10365 [Marinilabiliales bacterium]